MEGSISRGDGLSGMYFKERTELILSHRVRARSVPFNMAAANYMWFLSIGNVTIACELRRAVIVKLSWGFEDIV